MFVFFKFVFYFSLPFTTRSLQPPTSNQVLDLYLTQLIVFMVSSKTALAPEQQPRKCTVAAVEGVAVSGWQLWNLVTRD